MSDIIDFEWDDESDPLTEESHDEEQSFSTWAKAIWVPGLPVKRDWQNSDGILLPGITQTKYEKGQPPVSTGEPFAHRFLSYKNGSKDKIYTLILRRLNSEQKEYDEVYQYKNWNEAIRQKMLDEYGVPVLEAGKEVWGNLVECPNCNTIALITDRTLDCTSCDFVGRGDRVVERNAWTDYQQDEFMALKERDPVGYGKLLNSGKALLKGKQEWVYLHGWAEDTGYDRSFGEVRRYLKDITIYADEKAWQAARDEAGNNGNATTKPKPSNRPAEWASVSEDDFNSFVYGLWDSGKSLQEIADTGKFAGKTVDGNEVDLQQLFKDALGLDIPAPMIKMEMKKG